MKLSEVQETKFVKALVAGPSSTGKTVFACSFPGQIEYWDFDNKISSAAIFYRAQPEVLARIEVKQFGKMKRDDRMRATIARIQEIQKLQHDKKPLPFDTLVVDSLTTFVGYLLDDYIYVSQKGIKRPLEGVNAMQDYQLLDRHMTQILTGLLTLECNVVVIAHTQLEKDESTGAMTNSVLMPGKFAAKLPIYFEEVYHSKVDSTGKFLLQTQGDSRTTCRTQRGLAKEVPAHYSSLVLK